MGKRERGRGRERESERRRRGERREETEREGGRERERERERERGERREREREREREKRYNKHGQQLTDAPAHECVYVCACVRVCARARVCVDMCACMPVSIVVRKLTKEDDLFHAAHQERCPHCGEEEYNGRRLVPRSPSRAMSPLW